ncbi:CBS domain-containing protein [soil metagenome]|jgi:CBS domain-containing protein
MLIADLLKHKGSSVVTIAPDAVVTALLAALAEHRVGALVVLDGDRIVGIISERDVVRSLHDRGASALELPVSELMTSPVISCSPGDGIDQIALLMTERRFRHMPVVTDGSLIGIVTIGDVVAARIRQLEFDRKHLESYISQGA